MKTLLALLVLCVSVAGTSRASDNLTCFPNEAGSRSFRDTILLTDGQRFQACVLSIITWDRPQPGDKWHEIGIKPHSAYVVWC